MTKGRAALPCTAAKQTLGREEGGVFASAYLATTIYGRVTLPFVIPSGSRGICGAPRLPHKGLGFVSSHTHSLAPGFFLCVLAKNPVWENNTSGAKEPV